MSGAQTWDPKRYSENARFVSDLGMAAVELLAPLAGERILDLGCGDGALTRKLLEMGCDVVGVDGSPAQIDAARAPGLDARVMDGERLPFAAECGGHGCVARIVAALDRALARRGIDSRRLNPWYFPTSDDYGARLRRSGFTVRSIALIPRPTPLPGDITGWLETFAESFLSGLDPAERPAFVEEVMERLRSELCDAEGRWTADYVRLRFAADKPRNAAGGAR